MTSFFKFYKIPLINALIFLFFGYIYSIYTPHIYQATSIASLSRKSIENPEYGLPELRNRWVWMRDGLNYKNILEADSTAQAILEQTNKLRSLGKANLKTITLKDLKSGINIDFSGPDDNLYTIKTKFKNPKTTLYINNALLNKLQIIIQNQQLENYQNVIDSLSEKSESAIDQKEKEYINNIIYKLKVTKVTVKTLSNKLFQIIQSPTNSIIKAWPKVPFIIISFTIMGLTLGFIYCILFQRRKFL